jgi:hypothetical protein
VTDDLDDDVPPTGGFHDAQKRHYDALAKACNERNLREVQRLALMTLTWWNGENYPLGSDSDVYGEISARIAPPPPPPMCVACRYPEIAHGRNIYACSVFRKP